MKVLPRILASLLVAAPLALYGCGGGGAGVGGGGGTGTVTGRVVPNASASSSKAAISAHIAVDGTPVASTTAADGTFTLTGVPAGLHTIVAEDVDSSGTAVVQVSSGGTVDVGTLSLRDAGQVSGLITDSQTHGPIAGARIAVTEMVLTNTSDVSPHPVRVDETDLGGSYTVKFLPVGDYLVNISSPGYSSNSLKVSVSAATTSPGDATLTPIPAGKAGTVNGTAYVVNNDGTQHPVAGVLVRLFSAMAISNNLDLPVPMKASAGGGQAVFFSGSAAPHSGPEPINPVDRDIYTYTDAQGMYTLSGVPPGPYAAAAILPGLDVDHGTVTVVSGQSVTQDFHLHPHQVHVGTVTGVVTDAATKTPLANVGVTVLFGDPMPYLPGGPPTGAPGKDGAGSGHASGGSGVTGGGVVTVVGNGLYVDQDHYVMQTSTDSQGHYTLKVPPGAINIAFFDAGYLPTQVAATVPDGGATTADAALKLDPGVVKLTGKVTGVDAAGNSTPLVGADVIAYPSLPVPPIGPLNGTAGGAAIATPVFETKTDAHGEYTLPIHAGQYTLVSFMPGYMPVKEPVQISADTVHDFTLKVAPVPPPTPGSGPKPH